MKREGYKEKFSRAAAAQSTSYELSEEEMAALKQCLLVMALDLIGLCERNGIRVALAGGSALGAVRHQGFIPWDDDLDLIMPREDYSHFCKVLSAELGEKYYIAGPNSGEFYKTRFPKVFKRNTVFKAISDVGSELPCGVFLDIFLLENVPGNSILRKLKGAWCSVLMFAGARVYMYEHDNPVMRRHMSATEQSLRDYEKAVRWGKILSVIPSNKWFDWVDRAVQYHKETGYLGIPTGRRHYFGEILPYTAYLPFSKGMFEGHEVPLPADCDMYLKNLYGDYMQIPPPEKREKHYIVELKL